MQEKTPIEPLMVDIIPGGFQNLKDIKDFMTRRVLTALALTGDVLVEFPVNGRGPVYVAGGVGSAAHWLIWREKMLAASGPVVIKHNSFGGPVSSTAEVAASLCSVKSIPAPKPSLFASSGILTMMHSRQ